MQFLPSFVTESNRTFTTTPNFCSHRNLPGSNADVGARTRVHIWLGSCQRTTQHESRRKAHHVENRDRLLTPGEVASLFRVDPKTVTRWAASGRIGSIRTPGGHRRFRESEVRALLRGNSDIDSIGSLALEAWEG